MRIFAGGREIDVPADDNGRVDVSQLRQAIGCAPDRALIQQEQSGENVVLPKGGKVPLGPYSHFIEAPRAIRG